ncbi:MAG TPA: OmpA family protein [Prolixibacteraceae bacterium]|nr:OmpA family protein [Prolixibacteraceae bacterium]
MKTSILFLSCLLFLSVCYGQKSVFQKQNVTPAGVISIGGICFYNDTLYLLLPSNILYNGKAAEASEANTISQKYQVWDVYQYNRSTGMLVNKNSKWKTKNASPNGFALLDDSTVVFINEKNQLESNSPEYRKLFKSLNQAKSSFTDPFADLKNHRIYFSSDLIGGKGKMDLWYAESNGDSRMNVFPAGNMNSPNNEISPSLVDDSIMIYSSGNEKGQYDLTMYDLKNRKQISKEVSPENEYFTACPQHDTVYFMIPKGKLHTLWKASWTIRRNESIGKIENIEAMKVEEIPVQPREEAELEKPREESKSDLNVNMTNYFGMAKYELTPLMKDSLVHLAQLLKGNPGMNIVICGHASPDGPDNLNMMLSYLRANEAYKWLLANQVEASRIFRIFGGEYLYSDRITARMFSIFTTTEADLPSEMVVYPLKSGENKEEVMKRFSFASDEMEYAKFAVDRQLPVDDENLLLLPVKDIHIVQKGETLYSTSRNYGIDLKVILTANNLDEKSFQIGQVVLIPVR